MIFNCDKFLSDVSLTVSWFPGGEKNRDWAEAEIEKTRENCDFCKPNQFTVRLFNGNDDEKKGKLDLENLVVITMKKKKEKNKDKDKNKDNDKDRKCR